MHSILLVRNMAANSNSEERPRSNAEKQVHFADDVVPPSKEKQELFDDNTNKNNKENQKSID